MATQENIRTVAASPATERLGRDGKNRRARRWGVVALVVGAVLLLIVGA
jgi:hypothetical protein